MAPTCAAPARAGVSVIKAAGKSERIGARFLRLLRFEKPAALVDMAGDLGKVEAKAGGRAAFEAMQLAHASDDGLDAHAATWPFRRCVLSATSSSAP